MQAVEPPKVHLNSLCTGCSEAWPTHWQSASCLIGGRQWHSKDDKADYVAKKQRYLPATPKFQRISATLEKVQCTVSRFKRLVAWWLQYRQFNVVLLSKGWVLLLINTFRQGFCFFWNISDWCIRSWVSLFNKFIRLFRCSSYNVWDMIEKRFVVSNAIKTIHKLCYQKAVNRFKISCCTKEGHRSVIMPICWIFDVSLQPFFRFFCIELNMHVSLLKPVQTACLLLLAFCLNARNMTTHTFTFLQFYAKSGMGISAI